MTGGPVPDALPYGLRQVTLTPYNDAQGTVLSELAYPLPVAMTLAFAETEQFDELRGDDQLVAVHGRGPQVDWSLEAGGIDMTAWSIITGASVTESGVSPNRTVSLDKSWFDERPYFRIDGRVISDSGGNIIARIYRAKANSRIRADHKNGAFQTSQIDGVGLPLRNDQAGWLYSIIRNETDSPLQGTPTANPIPVPNNTFVNAITAASVGLVWGDIPPASSFVVQQSTDGVNFSSVAAGTNDVQTVTITGTPTGGFFTLTFGGHTTPNIPFNATHQVVQSALESLASIGPGNVTVTGGPGPGSAFVVTFIGILGFGTQSVMTETHGALTGGTTPAVGIVHTTPGVAGGGTPATPFTVIGGLTASTLYYYKIAAVVNGTTGDYCTPIALVTLAS